jgi:hypothetical protein
MVIDKQRCIRLGLHKPPVSAEKQQTDGSTPGVPA